MANRVIATDDWQMEIDLGVVVTSGVVSALVGGGVSYFIAGRVAARQEQGKAREAARKEVREAVSPTLDQARKFQIGTFPGMGRDPKDCTRHLGDDALCQEVLTKAEGLGFVRRWCVRRRLVRLFGPGTVKYCEYAGQDAANPFSVYAATSMQSYQEAKHGKILAAQPDSGTFDQALRSSPQGKEVETLVKELTRLSRSW